MLDEFRVGGTPERISEWVGDRPLVAPDGHVFGPGEFIITDLKTGTTEYGRLKMAMQLAIYAHSELYYWETGEREKLPNLSQKWGIIMNTRADTGDTDLFWVDLTVGWEAVRIAREIRQLRSAGKKALVYFENPLAA